MYICRPICNFNAAIIRCYKYRYFKTAYYTSYSSLAICNAHSVHKLSRHVENGDSSKWLIPNGGLEYTINRSIYTTSRMSLNTDNIKTDSTPSAKEKLKRAVKEYGGTVIVFHVCISLFSLGMFYILVSSGVDIGKLLQYIGITGNFASNAGTFVTAYAVHKVFAPVRISITLGATPFIVRYLRNVGVLKKKAA